MKLAVPNLQISAVISLVICALAGGFESLAWLWLLPVLIALGVVVLLVLKKRKEGKVS
mgnify:CR=1 FL=1